MIYKACIAQAMGCIGRVSIQRQACNDFNLGDTLNLVEIPVESL